MIHTKCSDCCFFENNKCIANQWIEDGEEVFTRGYCHLKRTYAWKQQYPQLNKNALLALVRRELSLRFDLLVLFDENIHTEGDLQRTINTPYWKYEFCNKIMIADISGNNNITKNISIEFLKRNQKIYVDKSVDKENPVRAISRLYKNFQSRYFLVLWAGLIIDDLNELDKHLQQYSGRAVHWRFPNKICETYIDYQYNVVGLYHKMGFHLLHQRCVEDCLISQPCKCPTFAKTILKDSEDVGFNLSFLFNGSVIY